MSLKPPSLWIEQRGRQHRVYWRNSVPGLRARPYLPFYVRAEAERFIVMAGLLGLDTASQVATTEDPQAAAALLQAALTERGLAPADPAPGPATARPPACGCSTCTWTPSGPTSTSGHGRVAYTVTGDNGPVLVEAWLPAEALKEG
jgi:hypothetical protein